VTVINTTFAFVFVHIPKCGGTSICNALARLCSILDIEIGGTDFGQKVQAAYLERHGLDKHSTAQEIRAILGREHWLHYTSFAAVREPLSRLESSYFFLRSWDSHEYYLYDQLYQFESFADFVASDLWQSDVGPDRIFKPQAHWVANEAANELIVDHLCQIEEFDTAVPNLLREIGVKPAFVPTRLPHLNITAARVPREPLSEELTKKIRSFYAQDYSLLGYP
jgi:hypothetical protein